MTRHGSFYPLRRDVASAEPVMFAYVLDQPAQREALQEEILERFAAIQSLSQTMATAQLESFDPALPGRPAQCAGHPLARRARAFHPGP